LTVKVKRNTGEFLLSTEVHGNETGVGQRHYIITNLVSLMLLYKKTTFETIEEKTKFQTAVLLLLLFFGYVLLLLNPPRLAAKIDIPECKTLSTKAIRKRNAAATSNQ